MMNRTRYILTTLLLVLMLATATALSAMRGAEAGPGNAQVQMRAVGQDGQVRELVFFDDAARTPTGVNTPIASNTICGLGDFESFRAQVVLTGTLTGTNPTAAIKWQTSFDGGQSWNDVGSWTTINATVTPASQSQTVSDVWNNTTAVAYGDCWRSTITYGGTTPGGTLGVRMYAENHD